MKNKLYAILLLVITVSLAACSSSKNKAPEMNYSAANTGLYALSEQYDSYEYDMEYDEKASIAPQSVGSYSSVNTPADNSKIIMSGSIALETTEFDSAVSNIRGLVHFYNGYTSSSNLNTVTDRDGAKRRYTAVIKIPAGSFGQAFDDIKSMPGLKNASQQQENVSEQYNDAEASLATRKIEEELLLSLIDKAVDISDLLNLERRLWEVRTDIRLYESQLKNIDKLVAYSTISVAVYEQIKAVKQPSDTLLGRVRDGFTASLDFLLNVAQGITYVAAASFLPLVILILIVLIIWGVVRRMLRRG